VVACVSGPRVFAQEIGRDQHFAAEIYFGRYAGINFQRMRGNADGKERNNPAQHPNDPHDILLTKSFYWLIE
jgi:hypothetical protein